MTKTTTNPEAEVTSSEDTLTITKKYFVASVREVMTGPGMYRIYMFLALLLVILLVSISTDFILVLLPIVMGLLLIYTAQVVTIYLYVLNYQGSCYKSIEATFTPTELHLTRKRGDREKKLVIELSKWQGIARSVRKNREEQAEFIVAFFPGNKSFSLVLDTRKEQTAVADEINEFIRKKTAFASNIIDRPIEVPPLFSLCKFENTADGNFLRVPLKGKSNIEFIMLIVLAFILLAVAVPCTQFFEDTGNYVVLLLVFFASLAV
ncbi:MAG: hypothetical protein ACRC2T_00995, partial [Thermoguttaceae bacterium]